MQPNHPEQQPPSWQQPPAPEVPFYSQTPVYQPPPPVPYQPPPPPPVVYASTPAEPGPYRSVHKERKRTSHTFHLLMTLCTCGLWIFVWGWQVIWHTLGPRRKSVTRHHR